MSNCWIGVAAGRHVAIAVEQSFVMFSHGRHEAARRVLPGDWVSYYSPREGLNEGAELRAFTAIGVVLDGAPAERQMTASSTGWARRMRWLDARHASIYGILDKFSFVTDRRHWGMYFRKSLFRVDAGDFAVIAEAMGAGTEFHRSNRE